ncbi:MAG: hypothetical protein H6744_03535 [Deltaproteobacteria bacterium]|nr:hypothetical protein [Deltaproteobacteria bacterium]MCB9785749.1 hypothetical protein [Deltaproteobacteria bacterium]
MRTARIAAVAWVMALVAGGCFDKEEPTCEYWVPKLTSAQRGDKAMEMVAELKCAAAIPTLSQMFDDGQYPERILRTLKQIDDKAAATPILKRALLTKDTGKLAASIVADWKVTEARPELEQVLTGTALPKQRMEALDALLAITEPKEIEDLLIKLAGDDPNLQGIEVNRRAVELLGEMGSEKAAPVVIQAAFMRDNKGGMAYQASRVALARIGPVTVPLLINTIEGKNDALKAAARDNGVLDWEWQAGPEIVQLLSDTLDPRVGPPLVANMALELEPPAGVSQGMEEKWRVGQLNRLKVTMLGLGHVGATNAVEGLVKILRDPLADAVNQRLHAATALALIGTPEAQDALLTYFGEETDARFRAPLLRPVALAVDDEHLEKLKELTSKETEGLVPEALKAENVATYLAVAETCKKDVSCLIKKLQSENKDEVVKAAVLLARGLGDAPTVRAALIKRFATTPASEIDIKRFSLMALTRIGTPADGDELIKIADNSDPSDRYWPDELRVYGASLEHRKP